MKPWMLYLAVGIVLGAVCDWQLKESSRRERMTNALLSLCAWPVFAPFVLLPLLVRRTERESDASLRIKRALAEARAAVVGTPLAKLLSEAMLSRLSLTLVEVEARRAELAALLARPDFQRDRAPGRPAQHRESVERLWAILERDRRALDDLALLAESLRAQLLLARYSGTGGAGTASELALELGARVESLNAWFELDGPNSRIAVGAEATDTRVCP